MENLWFLGVPIFKHITVPKNYHTDPLFMLLFRAIEGHGIMSEYYLSYIKTKIVCNVKQMILKNHLKNYVANKVQTLQKERQDLSTVTSMEKLYFSWQLLWQLVCYGNLKLALTYNVKIET